VPDSATPSSSAEVRDLVASIPDGQSWSVQGAGTKSGLGRAEFGQSVLSTQKLAGIEQYNASELVVTAGAGTTMKVLENALAKERQILAFEPRNLGYFFEDETKEGTIGGVIATNLSGPRRSTAGAVRDHFLGFDAVNGRGESFKSGGRVVKNVTGFDLSKLMAGSYGTLAVLVSVSLKVLPMPELTSTLLIAMRSLEQAQEILLSALRGPYDVSGASLIPLAAAKRSEVARVARTNDDVIALRIEGHHPSVTSRVDSLTEILPSSAAISVLEESDSQQFWQEVRDITLLTSSFEEQVWRVSVPPAAGLQAALELRQRTQGETIVEWGGGLIWLSMPPREDAAFGQVREVAERSGGHAQLIRAAPKIRAAVSIFHPQSPAVAELTRRLKRSFDPRGVLSFGRMYEGV
jgi:glycolate oxidase FAD binding subunit